MYSGFKSFTRYAVCKAYLPVNASISKSLPVIFWRTKFYILTKPNLSFYFFMVLNVGLMYKNSLPNSMTYFLPCYQKFYAFLFIFRYIIYFNLFLYQVWSMYLFFFCKYMSNFSRITCWKDCLFFFFSPGKKLPLNICWCQLKIFLYVYVRDLRSVPFIHTCLLLVSIILPWALLSYKSWNWTLRICQCFLVSFVNLYLEWIFESTHWYLPKILVGFLLG